jgi:aminocarboxymuconate-semialdehyde decarboxylase
MIVDIHCHFVPEGYLRFIEREKGFGVRCLAATGEAVEVEVGLLRFGLNKTFFDPERQLRRMDGLGVDRSVLSLATPLINYATPADVATTAARLFNDEVARLRDRNPARFDGWAFLPMQDCDAAARELRRAITELGLRGGHVASNINGRYLDSAEYAPIFEAAVDLGVPLFVHPTNPPGRDRMAAYELAVVSGYLFDTTLNVFHMIFGGLLDRYPTLRLCCAHTGGYALLLRARMQREVDTNPELAERITRPVGDYLKRLYYDTVCFEGGYLKYAAEVVGADRLVLGSDGPFPLGEPDPVRFIRRTFGDKSIAVDVLHHNAAKMFNLGQEANTCKSGKSS